MLSIARESNMYSPTTAKLLLGCFGFSSMWVTFPRSSTDATPNSFGFVTFVVKIMHPPSSLNLLKSNSFIKFSSKKLSPKTKITVSPVRIYCSAFDNAWEIPFGLSWIANLIIKSGKAWDVTSLIKESKFGLVIITNSSTPHWFNWLICWFIIGIELTSRRTFVLSLSLKPWSLVPKPPAAITHLIPITNLLYSYTLNLVDNE